MARARGWYTTQSPSGSVLISAGQAAHVIASDLQDPTLLRTRAFASQVAVRDDAPAFNPGNAMKAMVFRVVITPEDAPPEDGWPADAQGIDDVIFQPMVWQTSLFVPANATFGRPEETYTIANPAGGVADSAAERHMAGNVNVLASIYVGPVLIETEPDDPLFTFNWWVRCLIEATI